MEIQVYEQLAEVWEELEIYSLLLDEINVGNICYDKTNISEKLKGIQNGKLVIFKDYLTVNAD